MATRSGTGRGLRCVRLSEVPESVRFRALDKLLVTPGSSDGMLVPTLGFADRVALGAAAANPSERPYWISRAAYERVMGKR